MRSVLALFFLAVATNHSPPRQGQGSSTQNSRITPVVVLDQFNVHRERAGVAKVKLLEALSKGCDLHALYLAKNNRKGLDAHDESTDEIGYTKEGAEAGKRAVICAFSSGGDPREAVDSLMGMPYHRIKMLDPDLSSVGIGWAYRANGEAPFVMDVGTMDHTAKAKSYPVLYPVPDQKEIPLEFGLGRGELPNPVPVEAATPGYPITLQFDYGGWRPLETEAHLYVDGKEVPCWVSSPQKPAREDIPQPLWVGLIPKEKLRPETTYTVKFACKQAGRENTPPYSKEWSFTTRKSPP